MAALLGLALICLRSPLALPNSFYGAEFSTADGKALCCIMCLCPEPEDSGALQRPFPLTFDLLLEAGSSHTDLRGLQGPLRTGAVALLPKPTNPHLGKALLSPSFLMTGILADCCTFMSTNPRGAVGFGLEDYRGENCCQVSITVVHLLLLSCLKRCCLPNQGGEETSPRGYQFPTLQLKSCFLLLL